MENIRNFFKGMLIGIANVIPGVSGGTMAVVLNIYDKLISYISGFFKDWKKCLAFLLPIGLGAGAGILLFSKLIKMLMTDYPIQTNFFFIGLIVGSLPLLFKKSLEQKFNPLNIIPFIITLGILIFMAYVAPPDASKVMFTALSYKAFLYLCVGGFIGAAAMVVPGISGSFILLLMGLYTTIINAIAELNIPLLIPVAIGVAIGIIATTKAINTLLKRYPQTTYFAILGLVVGSIFTIFPGFGVGITAITAIVALIVGFFTAYLLG